MNLTPEQRLKIAQLKRELDIRAQLTKGQNMEQLEAYIMQNQ